MVAKNKSKSFRLSSSQDLTAFVSVFIIAPVGLILSIRALLKARRNGGEKGLAIAGIILGACLTVYGTYGLISYQINKTNLSNDREKMADIKYLSTVLEKYAVEKQDLPKSLDDLKTVPGFDTKALTSADGKEYIYSSKPGGCVDNCTGYIIYSYSSKNEVLGYENTLR